MSLMAVLAAILSFNRTSAEHQRPLCKFLQKSDLIKIAGEVGACRSLSRIISYKAYLFWFTIRLIKLSIKRSRSIGTMSRPCNISCTIIKWIIAPIKILAVASGSARSNWGQVEKYWQSNRKAVRSILVTKHRASWGNRPDSPKISRMKLRNCGSFAAMSNTRFARPRRTISGSAFSVSGFLWGELSLCAPVSCVFHGVPRSSWRLICPFLYWHSKLVRLV